MKKLGLEKRTKLTLEEHKKLSEELRNMSTRLAEIHNELYGRGYRKGVVEDSYVAHKKVRILISELEDVLGIEDYANFSTSIYYPGGGLIIF